MANFLVVSCLFPPEPVVSGRTSAQIAQALVQHGHKVTVVTGFPNRPAGKLFPGYARRLYQKKQDAQGFELVRCFATLSPESNILSRLLENLTFGLTSGWVVLTAKRPDVIYANTWPIVASGILFGIAWLRRIPLVISIQDIYPETLITQQRLNENHVLIRLMRWVDGMIVRGARHVIVISERFAEIYWLQRRVAPGRLSLIPNWIDSHALDVHIPATQFRLKKGIALDDFLLVYGGNIGVAAGVETTIEALYHLRADKHIHLSIAGAGSQLETCRDLAKNYDLGEQVTFHTPWLQEETSEVLRAADVLLLPTQREQSLVSVPSKLLSYMLAARPIIATAVSESDLAALIKRSQCGWVVEPDRPDLLAEKIKEVVQLPSEARQWHGDQGRAYVLEHFAEHVCLPKVIQILNQVGQ